jgi:hypothetical protein
MTIQEAITRANEMSNNMIDEALKIKWLSELDGRIYYEIIAPNASAGAFKEYTQETPADTELIVPHPWDSLYVSYLEMEIARVSSDNVRYANARILFNDKYSAFSRWYVRTHSDNFSPNISFPVRRY